MTTKRKPVISTKTNVVSEIKKPENVVKTVSTASISRSKPVKEKGIGFLFDKRNYLLMIIGVVCIALGFVLMAGGGSTDPKVFDDSIFNSQRLTVAPIMILLGFAIEVVAIMLKPKSKTEA